MKFKKIAAEYQTHSGKASDVLRQLCYAGIGTIWVFKSGSDAPIVPRELVPAGLAFLVALACDMFHYIIYAKNWTAIALKADAATTDDEDYEETEFPVPFSIHRWPFFWYKAKVAAVGVGYLALLMAIVKLYFVG